MIGDALDWMIYGPAWRALVCMIALVAALTAAIIIPLWLTGCLDGPACPSGRTLVMLPVGKVLVPTCL